MIFMAGVLAIIARVKAGQSIYGACDCNWVDVAHLAVRCKGEMGAVGRMGYLERKRKAAARLLLVDSGPPFK
jgi:hypothetical protein